MKLRHLAFMLLSRLGGLPPTLYRPLEEPEVAGPQEPATSLQTHTMGRGGLGPAKSEGRHGALSGPQVMLSAERSMRDLEEVTGKEMQSPLRLDASAEPRAPSPYPADPGPSSGQGHPPMGQAQQQGLPQQPQGHIVAPSRKRPKSMSPAPALAAPQEPEAQSGPAPVTTEELEAIMKGAGQQPKPRRKKQKTDSSAAGASSQDRSVSPAPSIAAHHAAQQMQQLPNAAREQPTGPEPVAAPPDRDSSSAALVRPLSQAGKRQMSEPPSASQHGQQTSSKTKLQAAVLGQQTASARRESAASGVAAAPGHEAAAPFVMPPSRPSGVAPSGQGRLQTPSAGPHAAASAEHGRDNLPSAAASPRMAASPLQPAVQQGRAQARPAESQGGSMVSDFAGGTDEERLERKRQRQEEKLRMKDMETPEEKAARRHAKREKKARKSGRTDTYSMADSAGGRTVDVSDITS